MDDCATFHDANLTAECSDDLAALLAVLAHGYCVESGTFGGKGARALGPGAERVDTVDPCQRCWDERGPLPSNVHAHLCRGVDFTPVKHIEVLFIDSGFSSRAQDLRHLGRYLAPGGLVVVDDAQWLPDESLDGFRHTTLPFNAVIARVA